MGCHALLQGIFPTQGSNLRLLLSCIGRRVLLERLGSPTALVGEQRLQLSWRAAGAATWGKTWSLRTQAC